MVTNSLPKAIICGQVENQTLATRLRNRCSTDLATLTKSELFISCYLVHANANFSIDIYLLLHLKTIGYSYRSQTYQYSAHIHLVVVVGPKPVTTTTPDLEDITKQISRQRYHVIFATGEI